MTDLELIRARLGDDELLCQLAEESNEMGKAALKLRRARTGVNPTPVTEEEAMEKLLEEIADVSLCLEALGVSDPIALLRITQIKNKKILRWIKRLEEPNGEQAM